MESRVPEEILREILKHNLQVEPVHAFLLNPYSKFSRQRDPRNQCIMPPADALLVSKCWLRVGTPLFYRTIVLHNSRQTKQLAEVLRENPGLGQAVRNVRLQGGFGKDLVAVMKHLPKIHSLAVNTCVLVKDSNNGLLRVLPLLNPTCLYIHGFQTRRSKNQKSKAIRKALLEVLGNWTSLVSVC